MKRVEMKSLTPITSVMGFKIQRCHIVLCQLTAFLNKNAGEGEVIPDTD